MDAFVALADPTRRCILEMLRTGPRPAGEIAAQFAISPPAISQHLKALRQARLIQVQAEAQRRIYTIDPHGLHEVDRWLAQYRTFWTVKLDTLESRLRADTHVSERLISSEKTSRPEKSRKRDKR
jgi:DNA-binding transcriptional ArsR family regulator